MTEQLIIDRIRAMTDPAEVERQLEEVHNAYIEIASQVRSALAGVRRWMKSSSLFTEEDLNDELKELEPATTEQTTLARYEAELRKRKEELTGKR